MTDLCTNNEWNGKRQQEDRGDDDVNGALRPSSLQDQPAKWVTHALQTATGLRGEISLGEQRFVAVSEKQTLRKERSDSHIFIFCTFFSLKWGISDFLAFRAEVRWLKNLANKSLCGRESTSVQSNGSAEMAASRWQRFTALAVDTFLELPLEGRPAKKKDVGWLDCGLSYHERWLASAFR